MDIFIRNIPVNCSEKQLKRFFHDPLASFGIQHFHVDKHRDKPLASLTVLHIPSAERFLAEYGVPPYAPNHVRARTTLHWNGRVVLCCMGNKQPGPQDYSIKTLAYEASQRAAEAQNSAANRQTNSQNKDATRFAIQGVGCGIWDYSDSQLAFVRHCYDPRQGAVSFGINGAVIMLGGTGTVQRRIDINYHDCESIVLGGYDDPSISFALQCPPKFYEVGSLGDEDVLAAALMSMTLGNGAAKSKKSEKTRVTSMNGQHNEYVTGTCFVYRIRLLDYTKMSAVRSLLGRGKRMPPTIPMGTPVILPVESLERSFTKLEYDLTDARRFGNLPFGLRYLILSLARNGVLPTLKVQALVAKISTMYHSRGADAILSAVRRFYKQVPFAGPETQANQLSLSTLEHTLSGLVDEYDAYKYNPENVYQISKRHTHINLVHKVIVTPAAIHLQPPEPEPTNRVLRRYANDTDSFIRVVFQDEDGGSVRYDPRASQAHIFHGRFRKVLDTNILIAGRAFSFLGFSHSSLRAQSCWFMAPIFSEGQLKIPDMILKELGDFSHIRIPAKCAARIGQNFTDTNATIDLELDNVMTMQAVVRNGYDFSDGVGTISEALLRRVWRVYGSRRLIKPTAIQIRFQGYKGMVSLDRRLVGEIIMLRNNMKKFEARGAWNLEICGAAFKPLPLILNRQLIKILEDLGVPAEVFLDLQRTAVDKLRYITTTSAINTASFLEEMDCTRATRMPSLIRLLNQIGLDYRLDPFLYSVVEMAVVTKLRDIKYRGRIPVESGHTLYGIMDETGYLQEGQVYVVTEASPEGGRRRLIQNGVVVSRSPAMHPGDVQIVNAVDVPAQSPLKRLSNVIVFSQHGERDLPSQLSGGDLDGDQFHVIFDRRLIPPYSFPAAAYPRVSAQELDEDVTRKHMSDFLVNFMESDQLGMLCNIHLQLADQHSIGTYHADCIKLANMASTAVDFSKTGIPVNMKECPKYKKFRPDFMAPSPRVIVSDDGVLDIEDLEDNDEEAFEDLDSELKPFRYYKSEKVLGHLYRAIDERQFLAKMQQDQRRTMAASSDDNELLNTLLGYIKRQANLYGILFDHHYELAEEIRAGYEESLTDILYNYAPSIHMPLSEQEAFAGTILGRKGGAQNKPLRELGKTMRERFEDVLEYTAMRIIKGDQQMSNVGDLDVLYDDGLDREVEALPRAIACLAMAVEVEGAQIQQLGELQSFKYVAAGVCLRELERYMLTTVGRSILPRV